MMVFKMKALAFNFYGVIVKGTSSDLQRSLTLILLLFNQHYLITYYHLLFNTIAKFFMFLVDNLCKNFKYKTLDFINKILACL